MFCPVEHVHIVGFRKSPIEEIEEKVKEIPKVFGAPERIFLQGVDGFAADYDVLMKPAELLHKYVPSVKTIGGYVRIDNFRDKSMEQLKHMKAAGFSEPYIGVESGNTAWNAFSSGTIVMELLKNSPMLCAKIP